MRNSDRWVTPGVIVAGIFTGGVVILGISAGMVYLSSIGRDPDPVLRLIGEFTTAISAFGALVLQLWNRVTTTKTEANAGEGASEARVAREEVQAVREDVAYVAQLLAPGRHQYPDTMYQPADRPPVPERGTAPAATGRLGA